MSDLRQDLAALRIERAPEREGPRWVRWVLLLLLLAGAAGGMLVEVRTV